MTRWHILDDDSLFLSCAVCHYLLHRAFLSLTNTALIFGCKLGSPFFIHAQGQTPHTGLSLWIPAIWSRQAKITSSFFLGGGNLSALAFSKLCRGTITQFKLYAVQFEEDYDYIRPIYYFMWLLMILCTQPTQLITFSMNNKWVVK